MGCRLCGTPLEGRTPLSRESGLCFRCDFGLLSRALQLRAMLFFAVLADFGPEAALAFADATAEPVLTASDDGPPR